LKNQANRIGHCPKYIGKRVQPTGDQNPRENCASLASAEVLGWGAPVSASAQHGPHVIYCS